MTYGYDAENRLMTASKTGLAAAYQYDPLGRRTRKSGTGVTGTFYLLDGTDEIAEYDGTSGTLTTRYIPGPAIDEPIAVVDGATGTKTYFHTNHQGSVIAMSGSGAALTEGPYTYDPYGNCFLGATQTPCSSSGEPYRFTGRRFDPETGLLYYRARYYDSNKGRFLQTDPVGYTADLNLYTYVGNDPTDKTDPSGNSPIEIAFLVGDAAQLVSDVSSGASGGEIAMSVVNVAIDAVAVASPVPGISEVAHIAEAAEDVAKVAEVGEKAASEATHGNSLKSTAENHRYEISDKETGDVQKTGISGGKLNKNGNSGRANGQVNKLNKAAGSNKYQATVKETGIPGRGAALESEENATRELKASGNSLSLQKRPNPGE